MCCLLAVCAVFAQGAGIIIAALEVGHKEIGILGLLIGLGGQRCPDGRNAGVRDRPGRQALAAVGIIRSHDIFRDIIPAAIVGCHPVPEVIVVTVALDIAGGVALQARVGRIRSQTVAEHLCHVRVLTIARFLLHKGCQCDQLGQGHILLFKFCIHLIGDLCIELGIEGGYIVVHVSSFKNS